MNLRRTAEPVPPPVNCLRCDLQATALAELRAMAVRACAAAGSNKQLIDFCLDVMNRTRGL